MHVDGFRFDLASTLARELYDVDRLGAFFDIIQQDPVISQVKLIAEPWDVGPGGYQVGNFPVLWTEWNGRYRDAIRRFWRGDGGAMSELATRLAGSADLYEMSGRRPYASINFVTSHDGFTLRDLVSYNGKHNEANGMENRDGNDHNLSWNCGVEGPSDEPAVRELRLRQMRNFLATLFLSQGVPMLCGGDEMGRTQRGNNNAFCQDNEISWTRWDLSEEDESILEFTCRVTHLMRSHAVLRRRTFLQGQRVNGTAQKDITWITPDGAEMTSEAWASSQAKCLGAVLAGGDIGEVDDHGRPIVGETLAYMINAHSGPVSFHLPSAAGVDGGWECVIDTSDEHRQGAEYQAGSPYALASRSMAVFRGLPSAAGAGPAPRDRQRPS
jgi:glycogen operon protein